MSGLWNATFNWTPERKVRALELWASGQSGSEIALTFGGDVSRSAVIGMISREGNRLKAATGKNPYARPDVGRNQRPPKAPRVLKPKVAKPERIARVIDLATVAPGDRLPPLVKLDQRLWVSLPNTTPKDLLSLSRCECRWPLSTAVNNVGDDGPSSLFCAAKQADNSPYCPTHTRWSRSQKKLEPLNFGKAA